MSGAGGHAYKAGRHMRGAGATVERGGGGHVPGRRCCFWVVRTAGMVI